MTVEFNRFIESRSNFRNVFFFLETRTSSRRSRRKEIVDNEDLGMLYYFAIVVTAAHMQIASKIALHFLQGHSCVLQIDS